MELTLNELLEWQKENERITGIFNSTDHKCQVVLSDNLGYVITGIYDENTKFEVEDDLEEAKEFLNEMYNGIYKYINGDYIVATKRFKRKSGKTFTLSNLAKVNNSLYVCSTVNLCKIGDEIAGGLAYKSVNQLLRQDGLNFEEFIVDEIFDYEYEKLKEFYPHTKIFGVFKSSK